MPRTSTQTMPADTSGSARRDDGDPVDLGQPLLQRARLLGGASRDPVAADPLVERERLGQRPAVLEVVVAAGGEAGTARPGRRTSGSARSAGSSRGPTRCRCRAARTATCGCRWRGSRSRGRAGRRRRRRSRARRRRRARIRSAGPAPVEVGDRGAVLRDRAAGRRCSSAPRSPRPPGCAAPIASTSRLVSWSTVAAAGSSYRVTARTRAPVRSATSRSAVLGREEVVGRREDLVAGPRSSPPYMTAEAHRGAVGEGDLVRRPPTYDAAARRTASSQQVAVVQRGVGVDARAASRWCGDRGGDLGVWGESTNAANCARSVASGNWARTEAQSCGSKSGRCSRRAREPARGACRRRGAGGGGGGWRCRVAAAEQPASSPAPPARPAPSKVRRFGVITGPWCWQVPGRPVIGWRHERLTG